MAATPPPVKVGARGTIASLVLQEIEHFRKLNLHRDKAAPKPKAPIADIASTSRGCRHKSGSGGATQKRRKKKEEVSGGGGGFLPSICSVVEISDGRRAERVTRVGYKNLRNDGRRAERVTRVGYKNLRNDGTLSPQG